MVQVFGKNAVKAAIESRQAKVVYVPSRHSQGDLVALAKARSIPVKIVRNDELDRIASTPNHQGYVASIDNIPLYSVNELIQDCKGKQYPTILLLDGIEDPQNFGAILRSADAFGVDGVIVKKHGEVPLNGTVAKVSTGAVHYVKVAAVPNLSQAILKLQENGFWIVSSADQGASSYLDVDYRCPIGLVVGNEGKGISRLVLEHSDFVVKIPMHGHVNCLNASVATGVLLANIVSSRL